MGGGDTGEGQQRSLMATMYRTVGEFDNSALDIHQDAEGNLFIEACPCCGDQTYTAPGAMQCFNVGFGPTQEVALVEGPTTQLGSIETPVFIGAIIGRSILARTGPSKDLVFVILEYATMRDIIVEVRTKVSRILSGPFLPLATHTKSLWHARTSVSFASATNA